MDRGAENIRDMPIGGKDAFLSKVTFRHESKWYSKTKQMLNDMTIEERAKRNAVKAIEYACGRRVGEPEYITNLFIQMATEQKAIDHSEEHLNWIIKQYHLWSYEMCHCDNNECCTFKEWIDKAKEE